jgi:S-adenosylmethionine:tRNA ribosyltransferase-isomerase
VLHPKYLSIIDYTYPLPEHRIAKYPLPIRDQSKLLIYKNGFIESDTYANIADHLPAKSFLVFNNTKVIEARLLFQKSNGSTIEIFCLEPDKRYPDITTAMLQKEKVWWRCLIGGAKKWKEGPLSILVQTKTISFTLTAQKKEQLSDSYLVEFTWNQASLSFAEVLHYAGLIPLPPYLQRPANESDKERYQTIYASMDGSVAAPTAGLHFTDSLFSKLKEKSIRHDFVTLHVGAGTFKPVKAATMDLHEMHAEFIEVTTDFIDSLRTKTSQSIIPVGTTSLRTLESLYWLGLKTFLNPSISPDALLVHQWDPYEPDQIEITKEESLKALSDWLHKQNRKQLITQTQIIIAPGYRFRIADALITNFHQPQSTLLLLVAAAIGDDWKKIYNYALENDFRFLSYGDGSLIWIVS